MDATVQKSAIGTVSATQGEVFAKGEDGTTRRLHVGDTVYEGDVIITATGSSIEIAMSTGQLLPIQEQQTVALDAEVSGTILQDPSAAAVTPLQPSEAAKVIQALTPGAATDDPNLLLEQEAAAAGLTGGGGSDGGSTFVRLIGVTETTSPTGYDFGVNPDGSPGTFDGTALPVVSEPTVSVSVQVSLATSETPQESGELLLTRPDITLVSAGAADVIEGSSGGFRPVTFYILLDAPTDHEVTVNYVIAPLPGTDWGPDGDFFDGALTGTVVIPAGYAGFTVTENIVEDKLVEANGQFTITLTDPTGATIDPTAATATVTIVDDDTAPVARDDTNVVVEDNFVDESESQTVSTSGNVLQTQPHGDGGDVADTDADGDALTVVAPGTFEGAHGTLVLNQDGSYIYFLNNNDPAVQGLSAGETLPPEVFPYQATDGVNSPASATLTITIVGTDDGVTITGIGAEGGDETVFEANLEAGSAPDEGVLTQTGAFEIVAKDGIATVQVGEASLTLAQLEALGDTPVTIVTDAGTLVLNGYSGDAAGGAVSYSYTLDSNVLTPGIDQVSDDFVVTVTDKDGSFDTSTLSITIVDDVPQAAEDTGTATEGGTLTADGIELAGVLDNDTIGADGGGIVVGVAKGATDADATTGVDSEITGDHGKLTLHEDGTYTYVAFASVDAGETDVFTYTMQDADGDLSHTTLTITFAGDNNAPTANDGSAAQSDVLFGLGTQTPSTGSLNFNYGGDTPVDVSMVYDGGLGTAVKSSSGGVTTFTAASWTLTINELTGAYSFTQTDAYSHDAGTDSDSGKVTVTLTDSDNSVKTIELALSIADDVPNLYAIQDAVVANTTGQVTGLIDVNYGGDGPDATAPLTITSWDQLAGFHYELTDNGTHLTAYIGDTVDPTKVFYDLKLDGDGSYTLDYTNRPSTSSGITFLGGGGAGSTEYLPAASADGSITMVFDGALFDSSGNVVLNDPTNDADNIKQQGSGFGVGSASDQTVMNNGEGFVVTFDAANNPNAAVTGFSFTITQQGKDADFTVNWRADDGTAGSGDESFHISGSQGTVTFSIDSGDVSSSFDKLEIWFTDLSDKGNVRIDNFSLSYELVAPDQPLHFEVAAADSDGDATASVGFDVLLQGGSGPDYNLQGDGDSDVLRGGSGSDTLTGNLGADTFQWALADAGTAPIPEDHVTDFGNGADVLDLKDLLEGGSHTNEALENYMSFTFDSLANATTITIKSGGTGSDVDQKIVLDGYNVYNDPALNGAVTNHDVIDALVSAGKLITD